MEPTPITITPCEGSRVRQTPEEDQKTYWPKRCGNNNKDEDNSLKALNDENHPESKILKILMKNKI